MLDEVNCHENLSGVPSSTFPQKLFAMSVQEFDQGDVIHWLPHGLAFKVVDSDKFSEEVIPKYFKHTKLTSFQRQLNLYGFRRITKGDDHGAYFHPNFQRGRRDLLFNIRRLPAKGNRFSIDSSSIDAETVNSSKFDVFALSDCEAMDDFELPPKKKISTHLEDSCSDQLPCGSFFNFSGLKSDPMRFHEVPSSVNQSRQRSGSNIEPRQSMKCGPFSNSRSGYPISPPLPTMSRLTMNIGYTKHLATNSSSHEKGHITGEAILEPSQYTSYNLLSKKRLHGPHGNATDSISILNLLPKDPSSFQQAQNDMRMTLSQPAIVEYPLQTPQLNSMYNTTTNSTSITDFKLLMAQTAASDFSNWNDGSIWQPRAISHSSSSSDSLFSEDESFQLSHDYDENFDDVPSFDEAMDIMMGSKP